MGPRCITPALLITVSRRPNLATAPLHGALCLYPVCHVCDQNETSAAFSFDFRGQQIKPRPAPCHQRDRRARLGERARWPLLCRCSRRLRAPRFHQVVVP